MSIPATAIAAASETTSGRDTLKLEAHEAVRYARFLDFMKFGETWSVTRDTSGSAWLVTAEKSKKVKKAFRDHQGSVYKCGEEQNCIVKVKRTVVLDEKTGQVIRRSQLKSFSNN